MTQAAPIVLDFAPPAPGTVLKEKLLGRSRLTQRQVAAALGVSQPRLTMMFKGRCPVSAEIALRVERAFGISAEFWMRVRVDHELFSERQRLAAVLADLPPFSNADVHAANPRVTQEQLAA